MSPRHRVVGFVRGLFILGLLASLMIVASSGPVQAHSSETGSEPVADARLDDAPNRVVITFDSPLMDIGAALVVRAADGSDVTSGPPEINRNEISVPVRTDVAGGEFTVAYRVVSQDGHTVTSTFDYTVLGGADPATATPEGTATALPQEASTPPSPPGTSPSPSAPSDVAAGEEPADSGGMPVLWLVGGLLGLTVIIVGAIALRR